MKVLRIVAFRAAAPGMDAEVVAPLVNLPSSAAGFLTSFLIRLTNSLPGPPPSADVIAAIPAGSVLIACEPMPWSSADWTDAGMSRPLSSARPSSVSQDGCRATRRSVRERYKCMRRDLGPWAS